jgi:hypothetical protein
VQVGVDDAVPFSQILVVHEFRDRRDAGVVDENVDLRENL